MNSESNSKTPRTPSAKARSYKRVHRANSPILVTAEADEPTMQALKETPQPVMQVAVEERPSAAQEAPRRRMPAFFTSIGKGSKNTSEANPQTARMARALRGKSASRTQEEAVPAKKPVAAKTDLAPKRPPSRFKMRYLWGMMIYILIAEYLGNLVTVYMNSIKINAPLFQWHAPWGLVAFDRATLVFLAILVVILIVMARFDLIPSSLGAMAGAPTARKGFANAKKDTPTFDTKASQPMTKQGVTGSNDDLYQEYRANQRYYQKRDRKR
jgi:hypothetical protein